MWRRADVLHLEQLPSDWNAYDRIVSCGMLEYIQKDQLQDVLNDLWRRLKQDGKLAVFIASKNRMTRLCVERWWKAYTYHEQEIQSMFQASQFREYTITKCRGRSIFMVVAKVRGLSLPSASKNLHFAFGDFCHQCHGWFHDFTRVKEAGFACQPSRTPAVKARRRSVSMVIFATPYLIASTISVSMTPRASPSFAP